MPRLIGLEVGGTLLFVTGLIDDFRHLRPHTKLIAQILAACVMVVGGVQIGTPWLAPIAIPLTILWIVGITNAFNLLDNMDGLSAGIAVIAAAFLFALQRLGAASADAGGAVPALGGGALGFLVFNFNPARIFMGDCGSMFLGFTSERHHAARRRANGLGHLLRAAGPGGHDGLADLRHHAGDHRAHRSKVARSRRAGAITSATAWSPSA